MKRAIVVSVRESVDKETSESKLWVSLAIMPSRMNNGNLYYPKKTDMLVLVCFGEHRSPDKYTANKKLTIGALVDISYGFNEFTQKPFVSELIPVTESPYTENDLIYKG